jgi:hypothetical protein
MRPVFPAVCLAAVVALSGTQVVGATSTRPNNAIFPFRASEYTTSLAAARAFGLLIGFDRKDPYRVSGRVIGIVAAAPTFESYMHVEESGGVWYVTSVTSPTIDVTAPKANGEVGTTINVRALALGSVSYLATMQTDDSKLTPGTSLKKSATNYVGPVTSVGADEKVGIFAGTITFTPRKDQWGYVLVFSTNDQGVSMAAQSVRISN